jgi:hypothetical protein
MYSCCYHYRYTGIPHYAVPATTISLQEKRSLEDLGNRIAEAIREKRRVRTRLNNYSASPPPSAVYNAAGASPPGMYTVYYTSMLCAFILCTRRSELQLCNSEAAAQRAIAAAV